MFHRCSRWDADSSIPGWTCRNEITRRTRSRKTARTSRSSGSNPTTGSARAASRGDMPTLISSGIVRFEPMIVARRRRIIRVTGQGDLIGQEALPRQADRDDAVACAPVSLQRVSVSLLDDAE